MRSISEDEISVPIGSENPKVYYRVYGTLNTAVSPLVCVHGIGGNCMDFHYLASEISDFAIILIDIPGRGRSDWLKDSSLYNYNTYCRTVLCILRHLGIKRCNFLGTSMGGIVGMFLASRFPYLIERLVLNDVGPYMAERPLKALIRYLTHNPTFSDISEVEDYVKSTLAGFGITKKEHWDHVVNYAAIKCPSGYIMSFDPEVGTALRNELQDTAPYMDIWNVWNEISCKILVLRGEHSNILTKETLRQMLASKDSIDHITYLGTGHAPALFDENKIADIHSWLISND